MLIILIAHEWQVDSSRDGEIIIYLLSTKRNVKL